MNQRRDAQRNRARIIAAAAEVFREDGMNAPLELVARRADVGRGTLYRHFADRRALVAAVLGIRMEALVGYVDAYSGDDLLEHLLVEICSLQLDSPGLVTAVRSAPAGRLSEPFEAVVAQTRALLAEAVGRALRAGLVRPDTTVTDAMLAVTMLDGVIAARPQPSDDTSVDRAVTLVLRGLRSADRVELPAPRATLHLPTVRDLDQGADTA